MCLEEIAPELVNGRYCSLGGALYLDVTEL